MPQFTTVLQLIFFLSFGFTLCSIAEDEEPEREKTITRHPWHVAGAPCRIQAKSIDRGVTSFLVLIPRELQSYTKCIATNKSGQSLAVRPLITKNGLMAAEVTAPSQPSSVLLYLSNDDMELPESEKMPLPRRPVYCSYSWEKFVAQPANGREMLDFCRTHAPTRFYKTLPSFPNAAFGKALSKKLVKGKTGKSSLRARKYLRVRLRSLLQLPKGARQEFALHALESTPWYLFINGNPLASWEDAPPLSSERVRAGNYTGDGDVAELDLMLFLKPGELFPELLSVETNEEIIPLNSQDLLSPIPARNLIVQFKDNEASVGFTLTKKQPWYFKERQTTIQPWRIADMMKDRELLTNFTGNGEPLLQQMSYGYFYATKESNATLRHRCPGPFPIPELTWDLRPDWMEPEQHSIKLTLRSLPIFESVEQEIKIGYHIAQSGDLSMLKNHGRLAIQLSDYEGNILSSRNEKIPDFPHKRIVTIAEAGPSTAMIELQLELFNIAISDPIRIRVVSPKQQPHFDTTGGQFLRYGDEYAVLRRHGPALESAVIQPTRGNKLLLLDGLISPFSEIVGDESFVSGNWDTWEVTHVSLHTQGRENMSRFSPLKSLWEIAENRPDYAIFIHGLADLRLGVDLRDFREQLVFIIEHCRGLNVTPVLITLPLNGEFTQDKLRPYSLMTKELAVSQNIPVVDLYTSSLRLGDVSSFWQSTVPNVRLAAPNSQGRDWVRTQIIQALKQYEEDNR